MTATEQNIWQTLVELDRLVKSMPTANPKPNLIPLFNQLDELTQQLPPQTAPELPVAIIFAKELRKGAAVPRRPRRGKRRGQLRPLSKLAGR